jgi:hypothetical protein
LLFSSTEFGYVIKGVSVSNNAADCDGDDINKLMPSAVPSRVIEIREMFIDAVQLP